MLLENVGAKVDGDGAATNRKLWTEFGVQWSNK